MRFTDGLTQDLKLAVRSLARQKAWTAVAVVTLALGIGANSTLFTIINAVLLRPLPYASSDRIVSISESDKGVDHGTVPAPTFLEWRRSARSFVTLSASGQTDAVLRGADGPEVVNGATVTASYFTVIGMSPSRGRVFTADEDRPGGPSVVVLSDQLWRRGFAAESAIISKTIMLDGVPATVIGIMPAAFTTAKRAQYWMPLQLTVTPGQTFTRYYSILGRLRPGSSTAAARAELVAIVRRLDLDRPEDRRGWLPVVMTLHERRFGDTRPALLLLLGAVGVLLLIACANVSSLLLARAARRQREFAVRLALGASRMRLVRYLVCESVVLSLAGGLLGLAIPLIAIGYFVRLSPASIASVENIHVDGAVLAFTFGIAVVTGLVFGILPASGVGAGDLAKALSAGSARTTASAGQNWLRRILVVVELATALVLLTGAGLLTRSFLRVISIDPGFRPERLLAARVELPRSRYGGERAGPFSDQLLERVRALPGVESAALAGGLPPGGRRMSFSTTENGKQSPRIDVAVVGPGYVETIGGRLVAGRSFTAADRQGSPRVAMINATMARVMYPGLNPLEQRLHISGDSGRGTAIVGVMHDMVQRGEEGAASPYAFLPVDQDGAGTAMTVLVRTSGAPEALATPIRQIVSTLDAAQPPPTFTTLEAALSEAIAPRRFSFVLLAIFASLAATLAAIGLYGVMAYLIEDRTREIGIRVALGANAAQVVRLVVGHGMSLTLIGIVAGLAGSVAAVRLLRSMLYQVSIYDPLTFGAGAALLSVVALVACYLPARRASRVDPVIALRAE